jgi:hypothetical protein
VEKRAEGATVGESAIAAGVSARMGSKYEKQADIQMAYRSLMQKAIPAQRLVNLVKGGTEAKIPVYGSDGKKSGERADWKTRRPFIEMAAEHAGYFERKNVTGGSSMINLVVQHIGQPGAQVNVRSERQLEASAQTN